MIDIFNSGVTSQLNLSGSWLSAPQYRPRISYTRVYVPPTAGTTAVVPAPSTPATLKRVAREAWDTSSRSAEPISRGKFFKFSAAGVGAFVGVGRAGLDGAEMGAFAAAFVVDGAGLHAYEYGNYKKRLYATSHQSFELRIFLGDELTCMFESSAFVSEVALPPGDLYVYGYLYKSDDRIKNAAYATGAVQFGAA
ncbi:MAG: hypothetical protein WC107_07690 [Patescibacteria group bacterium]